MSLKIRIAIMEKIVNISKEPPFIIIIQKDGKTYLADKGELVREVTQEEILQIKTRKIFLDEDFLRV